MTSKARRIAILQRVAWTIGAAVLALGASQHAAASTYVPPRNLAVMAAQGQLVAVVAAGVTTVELEGTMPVRVTDMTVQQVLSNGGGAGAGDTIEVLVPGGEKGQEQWIVDGSPSFLAGETYLMVLAAAPGGRWRPIALAMGVFQSVTGRHGKRLWAPLPEAREMAALPRPDGEPAEVFGTYREEALVEHLRDVLAGKAAWNHLAVEAAPDELPLTSSALAAPTSCRFLGQSSGTPSRWKTFDSNGTVSISAASGGDRSLPSAPDELAGAIADWQAVPGTRIKLRYNGERKYNMACTGGKDAPAAGDNVVVFGDPCDDIPDLAACSGVLAYGGAWSSGTNTYDGQKWNTIMSLYIVVNNEAGCLGAASYRKMLTHELGHGLGFSHVDDPNALMYPYCCNGIAAADTSCAQYLYAAGGTNPPAKPAGVAASDSTFTELVRVTWAAAAGAGSYSIWRRPAGASGQASQVGSSATTSYDDGSAEPAVTYAYSVQASNAFGSSARSTEDQGTRACRGIGAPALSGQSSATSGQAYTLSWSDTNPGGTYRLEEDQAPTFTNPSVRDVNGTAIEIVSTASAQTSYSFRVIAVGGCGGTTLTSGFSNVVTVTVAPVAKVEAVYIPSAAHAAGLNGTQWRTALAVLNSGQKEARLTVELLKADQDNSHPQSATLVVPAGGSVDKSDVLQDLFAASGSATLRVTPESGRPAVSARTYNLTAQGTYGQLIKGLVASGAVPYGESGRLFPIASASSRDHGFRTNVGMVSTSDVAMVVEVELYSGAGQKLATRSYTLKPFGFTQVSDILAGLGGGELEGAFAIVRTVTPGGAFFAYASVIDNRSGDPLYLPTRQGP